jgi:hypothetical protein
MSRRSRPEMIAETRAKLIAAARKAFGDKAMPTRRWMISRPRPG